MCVIVARCIDDVAAHAVASAAAGRRLAVRLLHLRRALGGRLVRRSHFQAVVGSRCLSPNSVVNLSTEIACV